MKARHFWLVAIFLLASTAVEAQQSFQASVQAAPLTEEMDEDIQDHPNVRDFWQLGGSANYIGRSRFKEGNLTSQHISYYENLEVLSYNHFFDSNNAMSLGFGYGSNGIYWSENPAFHLQNFDTASINAGFLSTEFCHWLWRVSFIARFSLGAGQVPDYVQYTQTLWGRYDLTPCYGVHIGYIVETGLRKDTLWPIIGLDYQWSERLKFYAVYPFELSATYQICNPWSIAASTRFFRYRDRARKTEPVPKALFEYRNFGAELRVIYDWDPVLSANLHVGQSFGGELRIANHKNDDSTHYKFRSAPYVGTEFNLRF